MALTITTDRSRLDLDLVHAYLSKESYWAAGIPREIVERSFANSICFGAFDGGRLVGFARVVSDRATYAYVCDVFVIEEMRGRGVGTALMAAMKDHPELQGLRRWQLVTRDGHALYSKFGFKDLENPGRYMEIVDRDIYRR